jgi:nucleoside-diphosphate-sugar epimerase
VAAAAIKAARANLEGAPVFNLGGASKAMAEVVATINEVVPEMAGQIDFDPIPFPIPEDVDGSPLDRALGGVTWRPFNQGVQQTVEHFRAAIAAGRIDVDRAIG